MTWQAALQLEITGIPEYRILELLLHIRVKEYSVISLLLPKVINSLFVHYIWRRVSVSRNEKEGEKISETSSFVLARAHVLFTAIMRAARQRE